MSRESQIPALPGGDVENIRIDQVRGNIINLPPHHIGFQHKAQRRVRIFLLDLLEDGNGAVQVAVHHHVDAAASIATVVIFIGERGPGKRGTGGGEAQHQNGCCKQENFLHHL